MKARLLVLLGSFACGGPTLADRPVLLSDDFDAGSVSRALWNSDHPRDFILNHELQAYVPEAASVQDGILRLEARPQPTNYRGASQPYVSGTLTSYGKFDFCFGLLEVRARIPSGTGLWPAVWLLPESLAWPPEIDVFEFRGQQPTRVLMTHHWATPSGLHQFGSQQFEGPDFSRGFHTYALEWTPGRLVWSIDGVVRHESTEHVPSTPMYLNIALAVGGTLPGPPTEDTAFPAVLEIDWIRVFGLREGEAGRPTRDCS
jgi:beta-glucanase (GH16 family)